MVNSTMPRDESKAALALKYGITQGTCERLRSEAWHALMEEADPGGYEFNMRAAENAAKYLDGIQAAAEALGISKEELIAAAQTARAEGRLA